MISSQALSALFHEIQTMAPTVVVHPADEHEVRQAVGNLRIRVTIEVTELAKAGELTVFNGARRPITDLGSV